MTERELSKLVVRMAEALGWKVFTISNSRAAAMRSHTGIGFPDLICVRGKRLLALELKTEKGKTTAAQDEWLDALKEVQQVRTAVVRPRHWVDGFVEEILR